MCEAKLVSALRGRIEYVQERQRMASALGRLMVQYLLHRSGLILSNFDRFLSGPYGKLHVPAPFDSNVTHNGNVVMAVVSDEGRIGVDVERYRPVPWQDYRADFRDDEWASIVGHPEADRFFLSLWTRKESLLKAYGWGLQIPLLQVRIDEHYGVIEPTAEGGHFMSYPVPGYVCYVCTERRAVDVQSYGLKDLLELYGE